MSFCLSEACPVKSKHKGREEQDDDSQKMTQATMCGQALGPFHEVGAKISVTDAFHHLLCLAWPCSVSFGVEIWFPECAIIACKEYYFVQ